ncbi:RUS family member 1 [Lepisosteus oculatus]|uniref:RUS family member 1 n=1 Tax=Lepisosteus oculatus TaxID=7918 RepID=UPI00371A6F97
MDEDREVVVATESYGSQERWRYQLKGGRIAKQRQRSRVTNPLVSSFKSVFLPQGYPDSVSEDYLQYQCWDTLQAFSSSLSGTLATQASLRGVGVGNSDATVAAATVTWLLRDGTGMLGRILFAWMKGSKLDCDAKRWRLFADVLNDIALFMEIVAPAFPSGFTLIVCIAGVFKSLVGVAGGATRAALTVHQARRDNMADVSAKDGSQETLVNLAGLLVSFLLIPLVTDSPALSLLLFFFFTCLHLFANYRAVRSVVMETLNEARLSILVHQYLQDRRVLSPKAANQKEPVFPDLKKRVQIRLGVSLAEVVDSPEELQLVLRNNNKSYLIRVKQGAVCVCLGQGVSVHEELQAVFHAVCLSAVLDPSWAGLGPLGSLRESSSQSHTQDVWGMVSESHTVIDQLFPSFFKALQEEGWQTDRTLLDWDEWRADWRKKIK